MKGIRCLVASVAFGWWQHTILGAIFILFMLLAFTVEVKTPKDEYYGD